MLDKIKDSERDYGIAFTIEDRSPDRVVARMPVTDRMLNPAGLVNAGAMIWLADVTATILALELTNQAAGLSVFPVAVNIQAALLANQKDGEVVAESRVVRHGRRLTVVRTAVRGDAAGLLAEVTSTHIPAA